MGMSTRWVVVFNLIHHLRGTAVSRLSKVNETEACVGLSAVRGRQPTTTSVMSISWFGATISDVGPSVLAAPCGSQSFSMTTEGQKKKN